MVNKELISRSENDIKSKLINYYIDSDDFKYEDFMKILKIYGIQGILFRNDLAGVFDEYYVAYNKSINEREIEN